MDTNGIFALKLSIAIMDPKQKPSVNMFVLGYRKFRVIIESLKLKYLDEWKASTKSDH